MEDRSKRTETARPQLDDRREEQREGDDALSATEDENDVELSGETDDEQMEDGEMEFDDGSVQVGNVRDPDQPTAKEHQGACGHTPTRSWCRFCVMGCGVNAPHRRSNAQDDLDGMPHVSMDCGFLGKGIPKSRHLRSWSFVNGGTR